MGYHESQRSAPDRAARGARCPSRLPPTRVADEAARLLQRYLLGELGFHRLELACYGFNEAAIRHAERVGFIREGVKRRAYLRARRVAGRCAVRVAAGGSRASRSVGLRPCLPICTRCIASPIPTRAARSTKPSGWRFRRDMDIVRNGEQRGDELLPRLPGPGRGAGTDAEPRWPNVRPGDRVRTHRDRRRGPRWHPRTARRTGHRTRACAVPGARGRVVALLRPRSRWVSHRDHR